ncbi:MAG TPA: nucleotidyl transferase AbiEii/AbiGii toxin family protein [Cytophagaceae bacterium]|nr:nucleotidyl transferase AbiEii/AbiGii toxin family protein [Cytophagaceae bacterium]
MSIQFLNNFFLVGGTALSLQIGHRKSIDLDLFSTENFDVQEILTCLKPDLIIQDSKKILQLVVQEIRVDFVSLPYSLIDKLVIEDKIRLASINDIVAMKLKAIAGRGSKKDFYDIYYLLKRFSVKEMIMLFKEKYPDHEVFTVYKSLLYFEDADIEPEPILFEKLEWKQVKNKISIEVKSFLANL